MPSHKPSGNGDKSPASRTRKPSLLGTLFVPKFDSAIVPMQQNHQIFLRLLASVFAMYGLLRKDYPGLRDQTVRLSFIRVVGDAWGNVEFTREEAHRAAMFFVIIGMMALSAFAAVSVILSLFVGQAHAESLFSTSTPDLASDWITFLFDPNNSAQAAQNISSMTGQTMPSVTFQSALATALGVYSNAILIVAAIILFYHLTAMVAETAHHGVPMGKRANQIWAPIRLVVAIGLLVPINGTLNSGQYLVLNVVQMGSALASNVWSGFVSTLAKDSQMPPIVSGQDTTNAVSNLIMMYACEYAYNYDIFAVRKQFSGVGPDDYINQWAWSLAKPPAVPSTWGTSPGKYSFSNNVSAGYDMCGSYTIVPSPRMSDSTIQAASDKIYQNTVAAFLTARDAAATAALHMQSVMVDIDPTIAGGTPDTTLPSPSDITTVSTGFQTDLNKAAQNVSSDALSSAIQAIATTSAAEGWVSAGAWFNKLSTDLAQLNGVISQSMPSTIPPNISEVGGPATASYSKFWDKWLSGHEHEAVQTSYKRAIESLSAFSGCLSHGCAAPPATASTGDSVNLAPATTSASCGSAPMTCILTFAELVASNWGVWQDVTSTATAGSTGSTLPFTLGVHFNGMNPLLEMANWGHRNISAAMDFFDYGVYAASAGALGGIVSAGATLAAAAATIFTGGAALPIAGPTAVIANIVGSAGGLVAVILFFIGAIFFSVGAMIAYVVPFLPFMHFFFNTITWIACVAEALIGIPMVALAHLNPEGDGLPGQAKGAYYMIFSLLLRPVLMVFGLIVGLLIMYAAMGLLNALYAAAVAGGGATTTDSTAGGHVVISQFMYTIIYVVMTVSIANHAFSLISRLPNQAMEWMGGKGLTGPQMGDPSGIEKGVGLATGYMGVQTGQQISQAGKGLHEFNNKVGDMAMNALGKKAEGLKSQGKELPGWMNAGRGGKYFPTAVDKGGKAGDDKFKELMAEQKGIEDGRFNALREAAHNNGMEIEDFITSPDPTHQGQMKDIFGTERASDPDSILKEYQANRGHAQTPDLTPP